jgi:hypothetical protein
MPAKPKSQALADQAKFVFQGTVQKVKAATLKEIPVSDQTTVVRVDRLVQSPEALSDYAGHTITVQLAPGEKVTPGASYVFFTNGWIFGDSLAVRSVGHEDATPPAVAALASHPDDPVASLGTREALAQAAQADLIVTGRVSAVRLAEGEAKARAVGAGSGRTTERISEHAPLWQEAVIDVDGVHKGKHGSKKVIVRFPSSTDARWHKAPKFQTGQEGIFMLHQNQAPAPKSAALAAGAPGPEEYTALDPADVQPLDELPRIKLAAGGGSDTAKSQKSEVRSRKSKAKKRKADGKE